jgi:hypothetical protein
MKKVVSILTLTILLFSCSSDNTDANSQQLFRNIYNNTSWTDGDGLKITFKTGKLFYFSDDSGCFYYVSGSYNNIDYDGCLYNTITNSVVSEDVDSFSIRQLSSTGLGSFCPAFNTVITFQVLDENTIEIITNFDGSEDSFFLNKTNSTLSQGCIDGTTEGMIW